MIAVEKRRAIHLLHNEGMSIRELAHRLNVSRQCVRRIIAASGEYKKYSRRTQKPIDYDRVRALYVDCRGFVQRMHEKLVEEDGVDIGYSTLTEIVRKLGLGDSGKDRRDEKRPDQPGAEMQHDTSPYELEIGGHKMKVVGSSLYLRYSKMRYLRFYPAFNRFCMKCFFYEALAHFKYVAKECIIDNTNLAVLRGTGANALMAPEMVAFTKQYGFTWVAHEVKHSDRKGGVEEGFWFVETNFFPGRSFASIEDLNAQALKWATERIPLKPHAKTKLIPAQLFEFEKAYLKPIPPFVPAPIQLHERQTDQYGYAAFSGNYYWVPGRGRGLVQVIEYAGKIRLMQNRELLAEYTLPAWGTRNERIKPEGLPEHHAPRNCKRPISIEENRLKALAPAVGDYLEVIKKMPTSVVKRYRLVRQLFRLSQKLAPELFVQVVRRAHQYGVTDIETLERIAVYLLRESAYQTELWPDDEALESNNTYNEADVSALPDLEKYDEQLAKDNSGETNGQGS